MQLKITPELHAKLKQMSKALNAPMSQCINQMVNQWIREEAKNDQQKTNS